MTISFYQRMSYKTKRNKQRTTKKTGPTKIIFTLPVVKILKDSLATFEIMLLAGANQTIPNLEFAHLTCNKLKQKLTHMLEGEEFEQVTPFDINEVWILYVSLTMYIVEMQINKNPDSAKLGLCLLLCHHFNAMIEMNEQ